MKVNVLFVEDFLINSLDRGDLVTPLLSTQAGF